LKPASPDVRPAHLVSLGSWIIGRVHAEPPTMILTFRYRLLPSKRQHRALEALLESQRLLYNAALEERIGAYRKAGINRSYFDQTKALTEWRDEDAEARACPVQIQRATLKRLDEAYKGFFRRIRSGAKPGFPRFKGKGWFDSFGFRSFSGIAFSDGRLCFGAMPGRLRVHVHRRIPDGPIKNCTFRRDAKAWTVSFSVEVAAARIRRENRCVGVDLGLTTFVALSDGGCIPSLRAARRAERRLRVAQRALARKQRDSTSRVKARATLRKTHAAIARQRSEFLHQASARLVRDYDVIAIEALNVAPMARGALARDVHDASWTRFITMLRYKAEWAGARVIEVDCTETSTDCSNCGARVDKALSVRQHDCSHCGLSIDRDLNAARNVLHRAGVGPGLHNADVASTRAGGNLARDAFALPG